MTVELDHLIVHADDARASATFLAGILGVEVGPEQGPFTPVPLANQVTLQFMTDQNVRPQHCAFVMDAHEFDAAMDRIGLSRVTYWADPFQQRANEIHEGPDGRKAYFLDPSGHLMEILAPPPG
ncbi:VOC family protein [Pseudonocardia lutea]|jgi:catechol 2,3-dioxygenase-like lactoylglutathione lyase family enzyme|uniref:VOC family protein n=1 Tax=Pseudonocardia lutea TaxID=2172015 RepID=A0ABW1IBI0_9PSEU